jgi:hypothetical protein
MSAEAVRFVVLKKSDGTSDDILMAYSTIGSRRFAEKVESS